MSAYIYLEGGAKGADSKFVTIRCQEAFHKLLTRMGFEKRKPRLVACGGRDKVYERFVIQNAQKTGSYVAMWIDSEEPLADMEAAWTHLSSVTSVEKWERPDGATDDQVLFMTTCMETWFTADRAALREHFGGELQESALPPLVNMESRGRHDVQKQLSHATRECSNAYAKGEKSYEILGELNPAVLAQHLPSFVRVRRILNQRL